MGSCRRADYARVLQNHARACISSAMTPTRCMNGSAASTPGHAAVRFYENVKADALWRLVSSTWR